MQDTEVNTKLISDSLPYMKVNNFQSVNENLKILFSSFLINDSNFIENNISQFLLYFLLLETEDISNLFFEKLTITKIVAF